MVEPGDFTSGPVIRWGSLGTVLVGSTILAYFQGAVSLGLALADIPISALAWIARSLGMLVSAVFGILPATVQAAFVSAVPFVRLSGPAAFAVSIVIVLSAVGVFWRVVKSGR